MHGESASVPLGDGHSLPAMPPRFSRAGTIFWSVVLFVGLGFYLYSVTNKRDQLLTDPERYLERIVGRDLDAAESMNKFHGWQKWLTLGNDESIDDTLKDAVRTYQQFQREGALVHNDQSVETLSILLSESGRNNEAEQEIRKLSAADSAVAFSSLFHKAYQNGFLGSIPSWYERGLQNVVPDWARDKMEWRLATKRGDLESAAQIRKRTMERGLHVQYRIVALSFVNWLLISTGATFLVIWLWRRRPALEIGQGLSVSSWSLAEGYAVLLRGAVAGVILAGGLAFLFERFQMISGFATVLSALPFFWLAQRSLLQPYSTSLRSSFGLNLESRSWSRVIGCTLVLMCAMILGETAIGALVGEWQTSSLSESVPEEFLFDPWPKVLWSSLDAVVWAPLVEEIVFRGFLYSTLRRFLRPVWAAIVSAILFGSVHGYSLEGFLAIAWSGFLWALVFEKSRSLWPGILAHAVSNSLAVAGPLLIYR